MWHISHLFKYLAVPNSSHKIYCTYRILGDQIMRTAHGLFPSPCMAACMTHEGSRNIQGVSPPSEHYGQIFQILSEKYFVMFVF